MDGICSSPRSFLLFPGPQSNGPVLFLDPNLTVQFSPPLKLLSSLGLGKFYKCSKVLVFEPPPVKLVERVSTPLFILRFDNEYFPQLWCTLVLCVKTFTPPPELVKLGISSLMRTLLVLSLLNFFFLKL